MTTTIAVPMPDYIREYRIRNLERYELFKRGQYTLWADVPERLIFLRTLNKQPKIIKLFSTFDKVKAYRLLDFLCEVRFYVEVGNKRGVKAFTELPRIELNYVNNLEQKLSELPPLLSAEDRERLDVIIRNTRQAQDKYRKKAAWYFADQPQNIGTSGKAASSVKGQWLGYFTRTLAESFIPESHHGRYQLIADLANLCGLKSSRQNIRGILLNGRT
ncbi:MAG: hypothetical protein KZQ87_15790 [Candidatus Thiodiazotropha sp. (ex Cardiolucina cf. quadrata)]|nr:hypothetical protein [Candidatus Thiodiazotropha sp. (ex Cardiolucina cf. quadrata)]